MALSTIWWLLAGIAIITELLTGTLYLLMVAIGLAAGALAAHLGAGPTAQFLIAAVVSSATVVTCYLRQKRRGSRYATQDDKDVYLDIGEHITVEHWNADRTAQVRYRGAPWTASLLGRSAAESGTFRIVRLDGNCLLVEPLAKGGD